MLKEKPNESLHWFVFGPLMHLSPMSFLWCQDACSAPPWLEEEWAVTAGLTDDSVEQIWRRCVCMWVFIQSVQLGPVFQQLKGHPLESWYVTIKA